MAVTPLKALLFAAGASVAVVGVAYVSGALDPLFKPEPPAGLAAAPSQPAGQQAPEEEASTASGTQARLPSAAEPEAMKPAESQGGTMKPAEPQGGAMKPAGEALSAAAKVTAPTFDVVRVEGNGSMVVAGNAAPNARVEVVHGATVLGTTTAGPDGAFAIVMEDPLKPGDYQLVLRATTPDNVAATSEQTAVVSIPEKQGGQVLAMVEEPGKASELLTVPEPEKKAEAEVSANGQAEAPQAPAAEAAQPPAATTAQEPQPAPADQAAAPATAEPASATAAPAKDVAGPTVVVEAVEIDGQKIFVAGLADPGRKVRAYANDLLLGDAQTSPDGHFLVEAKRDLPVGEYKYPHILENTQVVQLPYGLVIIRLRVYPAGSYKDLFIENGGIDIRLTEAELNTVHRFFHQGRTAQIAGIPVVGQYNHIAEGILLKSRAGRCWRWWRSRARHPNC